MIDPSMSRREEFDSFLINAWFRDEGTESEIERLLQYSVMKHLQMPNGPIFSWDPPATTDGARLVPQVDIATRLGNYRMDFVLHSKGLNTLIECDGQAAHPDPFQDDLRSALILHTGLVDQVIRFSGTMLYHAPDDGAFFACHVHRDAFDPNTRHVLRVKATIKGRAMVAHAVGKSFELDYVADLVPEAGNLEVDFEGTPFTEPRHFHLRYHHCESPQGRIARLLAVLAVADPRTKQELERLYWDTLEHPSSSLALRVETEFRRKREALSGPLDRGTFYPHWDLLANRFEGEWQAIDPEEYCKAAVGHFSSAQFARACALAIQRDATFPTIERLRELASDDSAPLGGTEAPTL